MTTQKKQPRVLFFSILTLYHCPYTDTITLFIPSISLRKLLTSTVKKAREQQVDTGLYCVLAEAGNEMSKKLGGAAKHTPREFISRLINIFTAECADKSVTACEDTGAFDWKTLGSAQTRHFFDAPAASFMNGPMDVQVKIKTVAQRQRKEVLGPVAAPDAVDDTNAEQQTDHAMKGMVKVMKERRAAKVPLSVEQLAVNPTSFAQFVENIFTLSFLVKDGEAGLAPSVTSRAKDAAVERKRKPEENMDIERSTFVMHLDVKGWRALTQANASMGGAMPHRVEDEEEQDGHGFEAEVRGGAGGSARLTQNGAAEKNARPSLTGAKSTGKGKKRGRNPPQDVTNSQEEIGDVQKRRKTINA